MCKGLCPNRKATPNDHMVTLVHRVYRDLGIPVPTTDKDIMKDPESVLRHIEVYAIILEEIGVCTPEGEDL